MACSVHISVAMGFKCFVTAGSYVALTLLGKPPPPLQGNIPVHVHSFWEFNENTKS